MLPKDMEEREIKYLDNLSKSDQIETKLLEFKSALPGDSRDERLEFLKDVSSLANAAGGELIIGVEQDKKTGRIEKIPGIEIGNVDLEIQRLENILRDGLRPRIPIKEILPISWVDSRIVLIIRIPQSIMSPHRVVYGGHDKFYGRSSNGKYPLDWDELRIAFNFTQTVLEKIREFRLERIARIVANSIPIQLEEGPKRIIHVIPISSLASFNQYDLSYFYSHVLEIPPLDGAPGNTQYNLDGIISFGVPSHGTKCSSYIQIYRNGIIEAVRGEAIRDDIFFIGQLEIDMVGGEGEKGDLEYLLSILQKICVPPNILFFLTLSGMKGFRVISSKFNDFQIRTHVLDRDILSLPELAIERYDLSASNFLRPLFNLIWNSWGYPYSPNYDKDGNWNSR